MFRIVAAKLLNKMEFINYRFSLSSDWCNAIPVPNGQFASGIIHGTQLTSTSPVSIARWRCRATHFTKWGRVTLELLLVTMFLLNMFLPQLCQIPMRQASFDKTTPGGASRWGGVGVDQRPAKDNIFAEKEIKSGWIKPHRMLRVVDGRETEH